MILGIDTTTDYLYLVILDHFQKNKVWAKWAVASFGCPHSNLVLLKINDLLKLACVEPMELSSIVACIGPGGLTSLRVGISIAEGLAVAGLSTWGYSAFELRAQSVYLSGRIEPIWILLDAQYNEVWMQLWCNNKPITQPLKKTLDTVSQALGSYRTWWSTGIVYDKLHPYLSCQDDYYLYDEVSFTLQGLALLCRRMIVRPPETLLLPFYAGSYDVKC